MIDLSAQDSVSMTRRSERHEALWKAAQNLEAVFIAEMLKTTGLEKGSTEFGGGIGEEQFSSLLWQKHANQMVEAGGIGLAEALFHSLAKRVE